jgi:hypothetical protein
MMGDTVRHRKRVPSRSYFVNTNTNNNETNDSFSISNNQQQRSHQRAGCVRKKPEGLICIICEGPAHGYNFDVITCESCKAFFRRNALKTDVCKTTRNYFPL